VTHPPPTDAEIIARSLINSEEFGTIFDRYFDAIFRFAAKRVGSELAADLTDEVFLRAFQLRARYDLSRPLCRPWLYGIASNVVGDHIRRREVTNREAMTLPEETPDPAELADNRIDAEAWAIVLKNALSELRSKDRDVLLLFALEEMAYAEIAETLSIPVGTVRSRLARARRRMREHLPDLAQTPFPDKEAGSD